MFEVKYVSDSDRAFWFSLDKHLSEGEYDLKVRDKRAYIISLHKHPIGVMRYSLFWDSIPFLNLIYIDDAYQGMGYGKQAVLFWECEMRKLGYAAVMTSTQADEQAQHFYRKLGYIEKGSLFFDNTPFEQPLEIVMMKAF